MQISRNLSHSLLTNGLVCTHAASLDEENNLIGNSDLVKTFITVYEGSTYIPIIITDYLRNSSRAAECVQMQSNHRLRVTKTIIFPLYGERVETYRTIDAVLKALLLPAREGRLTKVVTTKGDIFYGGHGVILKADGTPLLVVEASYKEPDRVYPYEIDNCILYINPKVFLADNIVYKGILNKVVPIYLGLIPDPSSIKFEVRIEDIPGFSKPQLVNHSMKESQRVANQFLLENLDNVLY